MILANNAICNLQSLSVVKSNCYKKLSLVLGATTAPLIRVWEQNWAKYFLLFLEFPFADCRFVIKEIQHMKKKNIKHFSKNVFEKTQIPMETVKSAPLVAACWERVNRVTQNRVELVAVMLTTIAHDYGCNHN